MLQYHYSEIRKFGEQPAESLEPVRAALVREEQNCMGFSSLCIASSFQFTAIKCTICVTCVTSRQIVRSKPKYKDLSCKTSQDSRASATLVLAPMIAPQRPSPATISRSAPTNPSQYQPNEESVEASLVLDRTPWARDQGKERPMWRSRRAAAAAPALASRFSLSEASLADLAPLVLR